MNSISRCKPLLGTYVRLTLTADAARETLLAMSVRAFARIQRVERLMSFHDPDSELSRLNRLAHRRPCPVSAETGAVLRQAQRLSRASHGLFDISIAPALIRQGLLPAVDADIDADIDASANWRDLRLENGQVSFAKKMLIDLGGIAKGYAVDQAMSVLSDDIDAVINAGGDIRMNRWRDKTVSIRYAASGHDQTVEAPMRAAAIASSAGYYLNGKSAIIAPGQRQAPASPCVYSVFASNCMLADALTKIAFLSGGRHDLIRASGARLLCVDRRGRVRPH